MVVFGLFQGQTNNLDKELASQQTKLVRAANQVRNGLKRVECVTNVLYCISAGQSSQSCSNRFNPFEMLPLVYTHLLI